MAREHGRGRQKTPGPSLPKPCWLQVQAHPNTNLGSGTRFPGQPQGGQGHCLDSRALGWCVLSRASCRGQAVPALIPRPSGGSPALLQTPHVVGKAGVRWLQGPLWIRVYLMCPV